MHGILKDNSRYRADQKRMQSGALLRGVIFTKDGHSMYPTFCCKYGKRYGYYVTAKAAKTSYSECPIKQIPAGEVEEIAVNQIHAILKSPEIVMETKQEGDLKEKEVVNALRQLEPIWLELFPVEQRRIMALLVQKAVVDLDGVDFYFRVNKLVSLAAEIDDRIVDPELDEDERIYHVHVDVELKRRDGRKLVVVPDGEEFEVKQVPKPITGLQKIIVQAHRWQGWLDNGRHCSSHEIGKKEHLDPRYIQRVLKYAVLAPDIIEAILYDQILDGLAVRNYTNTKIPAVWQEQRVVFGMV